MNNKVCHKCGSTVVLMPYVSKGPRKTQKRHDLTGESYYCSKCKKALKSDLS